MILPLEIGIYAAAGARLPERATIGSAAADIYADLSRDQLDYIEMEPGGRLTVPTGLYFEIPHGYMISLRPRSGLANRFGVTILNAPATIDSDYRGELRVLLIHHGSEPFRIHHHDRIAQMVVEPLLNYRFDSRDSLDQLSDTERGSGGFGSTGGTMLA